MRSGFEPIPKPEIFLAIVSRLGTDTAAFTRLVDSSIKRFGYKTKTIKISQAACEEFGAKNDNTDPAARIESLIDFCNSIRDCSKRNDFMALTAVRQVQKHRLELDPNSEGRAPQEKTLYIIDQFKRPEEIDHFRQIYGRQAIVFSLHAPRPIRARRLAERIANARPSNPVASDHMPEAEKLLRRDDEEEEKTYGQNVRNAFPLADFVLDAASTESTQADDINRFFDYFFNSPKSMPSIDEIGMQAAHSASLASSDLSRQVGAAVVDASGLVLATGWNDAPKAGGGTYIEPEANRFRDLDLGHDANDRHKAKVFANLISNLIEDGILNKENLPTDISSFYAFVRNEKLSVSKSIIFDILEFSRSVHAEMNLISSAARRGINLKGVTLYCTTYPCHNCAKHIVATGISRVVFLEPYPKSLVTDLHSDSIDYVDDPAPNNESAGQRVRFEQFKGVAPYRYVYLYARGKRKDGMGDVRKWTPEDASPARPIFLEGYLKREEFTLAALDNLLENFLKLPESATTVIRKAAPTFFTSCTR